MSFEYYFKDGEGGSQNGGRSGSSRGGSVGFQSPELKAVRQEVLKRWLSMTLIMTIFLLAMLSLYWAVLFHYPRNMGCLKVWIVDFDSQLAPYRSTIPIVGPAMVSAALALGNDSSSRLEFMNKPPGSFNYDIRAVRDEVYHQHAWAAIIVNPNATSLLQAAVLNGNASFDPLGIAQIVYVQARDESTIGKQILPTLMRFRAEFPGAFGRQWTARVLQNAMGNATAMANVRRAPQALSPAVGFSVFNLRPFQPIYAAPAVTTGFIYLILISYFAFQFYKPIYMRWLQLSEKNSKALHFHQVIIYRLLATIVLYFFLSFIFSLVSLAFQIPFNKPPGSETEVVNPANSFGKGSFLVYWLLVWVGLGALGFASENVEMVVGQPWSGFWLIFWVITNVSTSFFNLELAPRFFYWGYAWPLHNIVEAARTIVFDTHSRIPLNFGVLSAWCIVNIAFFPLCCYFQRWSAQRARQKESKGKISRVRLGDRIGRPNVI